VIIPSGFCMELLRIGIISIWVNLSECDSIGLLISSSLSGRPDSLSFGPV
jgi:hypothetical protein